MQTVNEPIVTAAMKVIRSDGTEEIVQVELDEESQRKFLAWHNRKG